MPAMPTRTIMLVARQRRALGDPISSGVTITPLPASTAPSTSISTAISTTSATGVPGIFAFGPDRSAILNWAAIAVVLGFMIVLASWRLTTMRHRSVKGFFLPFGLNITIRGKQLIKIAPPPMPPQQDTQLSPLEIQRQAERRARRAEERFQRRRTRGDNIAEGGQRQDAFDSDEDDDGADRETLPGYKSDTRAPIYLEEWRSQAMEEGRMDDVDPEMAEALRQSAAESGQTILAHTSTGAAPAAAGGMLSVEEYEARQRGELVDHSSPRNLIAASRPQTPQQSDAIESIATPPRSSSPVPALAQEAVGRPTTPPLARLAIRNSLRRPTPSRTTSSTTLSPPPQYLSRPSSRAADRDDEANAHLPHPLADSQTAVPQPDQPRSR